MDSDTDSRAWLRRFWALLLGGLVAFLLGLSAAAWMLRSVAERYAPAGDEKLMLLAAHAADYDVVVLGSSVIRVGFRPEPFEARLRKKHGRRMHAFGFGINGLSGVELDFYLQRILALPMPKLRWLLIDVTVDQEPRMAEKNWYSQRELDWQTPRQFAIVQSQVMARNEPLLKRLQTLWPYARHLGINVLNIGRGQRTLDGFDHRNHPKDQELYERKFADEQRLENVEQKAEKYAQRPAAHLAAVRELIAQRRKPPTRSNALAATWRDAAAARGVQVAYVVAPATHNVAFPAEVPGKPDLRIFDFNNPKKYRRLYDISYHYDSVHLTEPGARAFSRGLADELDAALDETEQR